MTRFIKKLFLVGLLLLGLLAGGLYWFANEPLNIAGAPVTFELRQGSSLRGVARQLSDTGILAEPWSFIVLGRILGVQSEIKAGNYQLDNPLTPLKLFRMITSGDVTQSGITFIEGWTFRQMRAALDKENGLRHDTRGLPDAEVMKRLGVEETHPEGLFFPDTYFFSSGSSDIQVLKRAYAAMQVQLERAWSGRDAGLPYSTPYEALIMASIIEKETGQARERPLISAVFLNRLRTGMRLQTDPTVIYGVGEAFDGNLRKRDLLTDTPYNTYTRSGLTPTPIAMPGLGALQAVMHPARSNALYFVAKGDGTHKFSGSLAEHNSAVAQYQKRRGGTQ